MVERKPNPFDKNSNNGEGGKSLRGGISGFWLFVILIVLTGLGVFFLADRFPGSLSSDDDQIDLVRSLAILLLIMSSILGIGRLQKSDLPRHLRDIGLWVVIFIVLFVGYSYRDVFENVWNRVSNNLVPGQAYTNQAGDLEFTRASDGHFYIEAFVDNKRVKFLVDTGATSIVLSPADAQRLGFDFDKLTFNRIFETANGTGRGASAQVYRMTLGEREFLDLRVSINQAEMSTSLLGMAFLERFPSFEFRGDKLILRSQ
ncbi:TIGR02281 family clan AA aspartic protease [Kiloniella sp. EL199]|uniref:TIGR02281 family clan AA aspartic protease n=1 Tax=Kiloniella sp. EL199 TaxID=2107581 RepID=UPI000EA2B2AF|nr:TIGR02281 family clan AA aspartic protease [Kiloniella sp. EL199]